MIRPGSPPMLFGVSTSGSSGSASIGGVSVVLFPSESQRYRSRWDGVARTWALAMQGWETQTWRNQRVRTA